MPTQSELRTLIRTDEAFNDSSIFTDAMLNTLLNEAALDMARRATAFIMSATWNAVANTQEYVLSGANPKVTGFLDVYWPASGLIYNETSSVTTPMREKMRSQQWLDLNIPGWQDAAASDMIIHAYLGHDSSGNLVLGVYPKSLSATPLFKLWFVSRGTDMTQDGHYPWTGSATLLVHTEPYHKHLADYARWKLYDTKAYLPEIAKSYLAKYIAGAEEMKMAQERVMATQIIGEYDFGKLQSGVYFGGL